MKLSLVSLSLGVAMLALTLGACSTDAPMAPVVADQVEAPGTTALKSEILGVHSATLQLWALATNDGLVKVHRITAPWVEATTTWNTFGGQFDPTAINTFAVATMGYRTVDVTSLVSDWFHGVHDNHGLLLDQDADGTPWAKYFSREMSHSRPTLEVCYETAEDGIVCVSVECVADTYIWQFNPDTPRGSDIYLYTGWTPPSEHEKQSLLRFELPEVPPGGGQGCTPGFWRQPQHLQYWTGFDPSDLYADVFGVARPGTLLENVTANGGGADALARHSVAALLNAASAEVDYDLSMAEIIAGVQAAYASGDFESFKNVLEGYNEQGCSVDKSNYDASMGDGRLVR